MGLAYRCNVAPLFRKQSPRPPPPPTRPFLQAILQGRLLGRLWAWKWIVNLRRPEKNRKEELAATFFKPGWCNLSKTDTPTAEASELPCGPCGFRGAVVRQGRRGLLGRSCASSSWGLRFEVQNVKSSSTSFSQRQQVSSAFVRDFDEVQNC